LKSDKHDILKRVYLVYFIIVAIAVAIIWRIIDIQFAEGKQWKEMADEQRFKYETIDAVRGNIYADDGSLIATSIPIFDIRFDAASPLISKIYFNENIDSLSYCLSKLFKDRTKSQYKRSITQARNDGNRYHIIKRKVTYDQLKKLREFPIFRKGKYEGGMIEEPKTRREMPFRSLAARTIGYESQNANVYVGLEGAYSDQLQGEGGKRLIKKIARGIWVPVNDEYEIEPQHGNNIITTIDINIQDVAEDALLRQLIEHDADHGCAVLMEVSTGNIKAIANLGKNKKGYYEERYNYAVGESSEPGSTFKLASVMAGLEDKKFTLEDSVYTGDGWTTYYGYTMQDVHKIGDGWITVREAFEQSSNVGISKIITNSYSNDQKAFTDRLYSFGLQNKLGIEIKGEGNPSIRTPDDNNWSGITLPWMSTGYGVSLTPLQLLTFYNAVANDGVMVKPIFVKEIQRSGELIGSFQTEILNPSICSASTLEKIRSLLEGVVLRGTAKNLKNEVYSIAGKTGTAQIAMNNQGYDKSNYKASFAGYFPADNPKYTCIVVINRPTKGKYYGSQVAGPVFKEIADKVYATQSNMYQIVDEINRSNNAPEIKRGYKEELVSLYSTLEYQVEDQQNNSDWISATSTENKVKLDSRETKDGIVPNVIGMGSRDAVYLLEKNGLSARIKGRGIVKGQSIKPGSPLSQGKEIILTLATL